MAQEAPKHHIHFCFNNVAFGDRDFAAALGRATLTSEGEFNVMRTGNEIIISGTVTHLVSDRFS